MHLTFTILATLMLSAQTFAGAPPQIGTHVKQQEAAKICREWAKKEAAAFKKTQTQEIEKLYTTCMMKNGKSPR